MGETSAPVEASASQLDPAAAREKLLAKVKEDNQWITDSLSGERLDINAQCVNVRVRTKGSGNDPAADQAVEYVQQKLQSGRALEANERVRVQLDKSNRLSWIDGTVVGKSSTPCFASSSGDTSM